MPDTTPGVGAGHISRCLAVGAAWVRRGGAASADLDALPPGWRDRYEAAGIGSIATEAQWLVVDDYHATPTEQSRLRAGTARLALIDDDNALAPHDADVVIDPNRDGGPHALLRSEFRSARGNREIGPARRVLLSYGAAPTDAVRSAFDEVAESLIRSGLVVERLDGVSDVVGTMLRADLAVAASGSSAFELACLGTPAVLVAVADNQVPVATGLGARGAAVRVERADAAVMVQAATELAADVDRRKQMSHDAATAVDGRGADRAVATILAADLVLDDATVADAELLFAWTNDPTTRRWSHSSKPIAWDEHLAWMDDRAPRGSFFVARRDGRPVGTIRFDDDTLSYSVAPDARGTGLGAALLLAGVARWGRSSRACVRPGNVASIAALELAGFTLDQSTATELVYRREAS